MPSWRNLPEHPASQAAKRRAAAAGAAILDKIELGADPAAAIAGELELLLTEIELVANLPLGDVPARDHPALNWLKTRCRRQLTRLDDEAARRRTP